MKIYDISQEVFSAQVYPGDPAPTRTRLCSMAEGDVYNLTAAIFDNIDAIKAEHGKGAELSIENATSGMTAPFHAGAAKYYAEKGVTVESK